MAIKIQNTSYDGEVLERLLTKAATGNELVQKGLIKLVPNVRKKYSIPRLKTGTMLQKRKEMPTSENSKGDFYYSEKDLVPHDFMAYTEFNPRSFEEVWRPYQPKGNMVFDTLPPSVQNQLLDAMSKQVNFELGYHFVNGIYKDDKADDEHLFNGILTQIMADSEVIRVKSSASESMIVRLQKVRKATPQVLRNNPNFVYLLSVNDADRYDDELTMREAKGANWTDTNAVRFKGTNIIPLAAIPDGVIVGTVATPDEDSNTWGCVNLVDDFNVIQIDKVTNAGERYFFKMLMMADTNVAFGEEVVLLDVREGATVNASGTTLTLTKQCSKTSLNPDSDGKAYTISADDILMGAMLEVTNTHATNKLTVNAIEVPAQSTVKLYYSGSKWFGDNALDISLPTEKVQEEKVMRVAIDGDVNTKIADTLKTQITGTVANTIQGTVTTKQEGAE